MNDLSLREAILQDIQSHLSMERFQHTLGVEESAVKLAEIYGYEEPEKASIAALLHDNGKYLSLPQLVEWCASYPSDMQLTAEYQPVLHAFAGAVRARNRFPGLSEDIYQAIEYHTTGRPGMSLLEKIIFIADYIEPGRPELPHFMQARRLAFQNIDRCLLYILEQTVSYLQSKKLPLYPLTLKAFQYYTTDNVL